MRKLKQIVPLTDEQQRESDLIDGGHAEIMKMCRELGMNPSESITIQFRLVLFGVVRMTHNALEERIAALEAKRPGPVRPDGEGFKP